MSNKSRKKTTIPTLGNQNQFFSIDEYLNKFFEDSDRESLKSESFFKMYFNWLESEREKRIESILESLNHVASTCIEERTYYRIVDLKYAFDPLCVYGSGLNLGGRFNIGSNVAHYKQFSVLYVAESSSTAYTEKFHYPMDIIKGLLVGNTMGLKQDFACFDVKVNLSNCIDITKKENLEPFCEVISEIKPSKEIFEQAKLIGINKLKTVQTPSEIIRSLLNVEYLKIPTMLDMPSNSQWFGLYCLRAGIQGIIYPSARNSTPTNQNITILIDNFRESESVVKINDDIDIVSEERRKITKDNFHFFKYPFSRSGLH
jgi:hypothetical protein